MPISVGARFYISCSSTPTPFVRGLVLGPLSRLRGFAAFAVLLFVYVGFMHAFMALHAGDDNVSVVLQTFRLLFLGEWQDDFAGPNETLMGWVGPMLSLMAVVGFGIGFMNLFISLVGESHGAAKAKAVNLWLRERAAINCQFMIYPFHCPRWVVEAFGGLKAFLRLKALGEQKAAR